MPRNAPNRLSAVNSTGDDRRLAGLDAGQIEQVVDQLAEVFGRFADELHLRLLLLVSTPSVCAEQQPGQRQDRIERRAELVRHVRQEARFQLVGAPQVVGPLVEFGIERHDAAIGVLQFLVQMHQLVAACFQLLKLEQHFAVLLTDFLDRIGRRIARQRLGERVASCAMPGLSMAIRFPGSGSAIVIRVPCCGPVSIEKCRTRRCAPLRPMPSPAFCPRSAAASRTAGMPGPRSDTIISSEAGLSGVEPELDRAAAAMLDGVAGDLRDRGRDAGLGVQIVAEQFGDPAGAAARQDDVGVAFERDPHQARFCRHGGGHRGARNTTTEQSSRPRR